MTPELRASNSAPIVVWPRNPFQSAERDMCRMAPGSTVADWMRMQAIDEFPLPTICLVNGQPLLRRDWAIRPLAMQDVVVLVSLPGGGGGGGGSNPLRAVLSIAVMVMAPYAAAGLMGYGFGAAGLAAAQAAMGAIGFSLVAAGVSMVGMALVNALVPLPSMNVPTAQVGQSPSPTYSLQAQGNAARLQQPVPVIYGHHRVFPDFGAMPYTEYADNDQFLYQLLVIGQGEYVIHDIRIDDTPVRYFEEIETLIIPPGGQNTLFNHDVVTASEVAGQEIWAVGDPNAPQEPVNPDDPSSTDTQGEQIGPFAVNPPQTQIDTIGVDIMLPRGLFYANDSGSQDAKTVRWQVRARPVDDNGVPGAWITLAAEETISAASSDVIRRSYLYAVTPGRYEVQVSRLDTKDMSARAGHELRWDGLRGYLVNPQLPAGITFLAMRLRATSNLSMRSSRQVNCLVTRKLPIWVPPGGQIYVPRFMDWLFGKTYRTSSGEWTTYTVATNSIAWAFADAVRADYGAKLGDDRIDLTTLAQMDATWTARGDAFNAVFDQKITVWEALTRIARCGRAVPILQGGVVRLLRDEPKTLPVARFTTANIVKGSFKLQYVMPGEETADAVTVEYFNPTTWKPDEVTVSLPGSAEDNPAMVNLFGCTSQAQAMREGKYIAAANRYRRRLITFRTEMEGLIPTFGDLIAISHDMPAQGIEGSTAGEGMNVPWSQLARVMAIRPRGEQVEIACVVENPAVHQADLA